METNGTSKVVAVSGGFDPLHIGHIRMFEEAKALGDKLVVLVNSDEFLIRKKGKAFMPLAERMEMIRAIRCVDEVYAVIDTDQSVCETLRLIRPDIFANGGDRTQDNIPENDVCKELGIIRVFNVGGMKVQSSSELLNNYAR